MIAAALLGALSDRARGDRLHVVDSFGIDGAPSTKAAAAVLAELTAVRNVLVVIEHDDAITLKSVRNLRYVHVISFDQLNAYDVLVSDDIVFTKAAFDAFVAARLDKDASTESAANEEVSA
jgi:large subunit ribosomal protein L4